MTEIIKIGNAYLVVNTIDFNSKTIILICPGGGYIMLSNREALPVATKFNMLGYNTAILYYSCKPLIPLDEGIDALKELSKKYDNIFVVGFSAGGHLAGYLGTNKEKYNLKGMILCYPVVSLYNHQDEESAVNLLGNDLSIENRKKYSVEERVDSNTVPCFIWTTIDDDDVPSINSIMLIDKLKEHKVYYESFLYPHGRHGLALADETAIVNNDLSFTDKEIAKWPDNANKFIKKILGI